MSENVVVMNIAGNCQKKVSKFTGTSANAAVFPPYPAAPDTRVSDYGEAFSVPFLPTAPPVTTVILAQCSDKRPNT